MDVDGGEAREEDREEEVHVLAQTTSSVPCSPSQSAIAASRSSREE